MKDKTKLIIWYMSIVIAFMYVITPYIYSISFKDKNFGASHLGKIFHSLNNTFDFFNLNRIMLLWITIVFMYYIFAIITSHTLSTSLKTLSIFALLIILYLIVFPILSFANLLLSFIHKNPPIFSSSSKLELFPQSQYLESSHKRIRNEFLEYYKQYVPQCIYKKIPGFLIGRDGDEDRCWRALYLKTSGRMDFEIAKHFPILTPLLKHKSIHNAFFSILDPRVSIPKHIGYSKSYLRYHMGIYVPAQDSESKPYIVVGGVKYAWREGHGILFDDMYPHEVVNKANSMRVVLYIDIIRNSFFDRMMAKYIENSPILQSVVQNQHKTTSF